MRSRRWDGKSGCAVEVTLSVMGGVWKPIILFHLMTGKRRFMELTRRVPNATQSMLTSQLRELEADGVVIRSVPGSAAEGGVRAFRIRSHAGAGAACHARVG
nr:helix-turn-helix domain-containing protein [Stenotrophomonas maltophilia]